MVHSHLTTASRFEQRVREIGRDLLARARAAEPSVFKLAWWEQRAMDMVTADPRVKVQLFRFVDTMPSLSSHAKTAGHLKEFMAGIEDRLPIPLRMGLAYRSPHSPIAYATAAAARMQAGRMAKNYVCGSNAEQAVASVIRLRKKRRAFTVDILGEATISDARADDYQRRYLELIESLVPVVNALPRVEQIDAGSDGDLPRVNVSVKLSALTPTYDPIDPKRLKQEVGERLRPILTRARQLGAFINFDIEQYATRDVTINLITEILDEPEYRDWENVGTVIQAYLQDAEPHAERLLDWVRRRGTPITVRLVKGAYWDHETLSAIRDRRSIPVWTEKWQSDACFERITAMLMQNHQWLRPALASHNVRSMAAGVALAELHGLSPRDYEIQMLYGMGDPLKEAVVDAGYRLRIYAPYGELLPGMAYLIRRLLENTSNESFLKQSFSEGRDDDELLAAPDVVGLSAPKTELPRPYAQNHFDDEGFDMDPFVNTPDTGFGSPENQTRMRNAIADVRRHFGGDYPLRIAGRDAHTREWYESVNPANPREMVGRVAQASAEDIDRAVEAARGAFAEWRTTNVSERAALLERVAQLLQKQRFELAAWACLECGKGWREADGDVGEAVDYCNFYAREMRRIALRPGIRDVPGESNVISYQPRGVVAVISPFNFPLALLTNMTAAAVVTGNTVVMKPAPAGSVVAAQLVDIFEQAGAPPGVVNFLPGSGDVAGEALVTHPGVAMIAFTGSAEVGCRINALAAEVQPGQQHVKTAALDMGGNNAVIVDSDADLDAAARGIIESAFGYSGQKCSACSRAIVLDDVYGAFVDRLVDACRSLAVGAAEEPGTVVGPVIDRAAVERVQKYVDIGLREARLAFQGDISAVKGSGGYYVPPTIFADVPPDGRIANEEIFGPVLAVIRADDFGEAIRIANATPYALCGGVYTRSPANIERARRELEVGNLYINRKISGSMVDRQPFGGYRMSGTGRKFGGPDYLIQFCTTRTVTENTLRHGVTSDRAPQPATATH